MIRNGKYTQCEHLALIFRFLRFTNRPWYAGIAIPNNVISATFKEPIGIEIRNDPRASWSSKFPGISIISPLKGKNSKCTPIIYVAYNAKEKVQRQSSVNFAGPRTAADFIYHLEMIDRLSLKYPSKHKITQLKWGSLRFGRHTTEKYSNCRYEYKNKYGNPSYSKVVRCCCVVMMVINLVVRTWRGNR